MKCALILAVVLAVFMTPEVLGNEASCALAVGSCAGSQAQALLASDCSGKKPYFDCLLSNGCTKTMTAYTAAVAARNYGSCSGAEMLVMGFTLPILMFFLSKFVIQ